MDTGTIQVFDPALLNTEEDNTADLIEDTPEPEDVSAENPNAILIHPPPVDESTPDNQTTARALNTWLKKTIGASVPLQLRLAH
jgi:hypothetical protein